MLLGVWIVEIEPSEGAKKDGVEPDMFKKAYRFLEGPSGAKWACLEYLKEEEKEEIGIKWTSGNSSLIGTPEKDLDYTFNLIWMELE